MQVDKVVTYDVGIPASSDSHDYGAGAACCREAGRRVLHDQRSGWRDTAGAGSMEVTVGCRLAMLDVLEGDQEWWVDGGCAESGERESPRRVGDDAPRDAVGVEPDEEFPAADRRLYAVELCALLV
ncbi:hypothetical protein HMPREF1280_00565 [Propionibacterium sp. KPL1854]|nr:hypothetical protein HMPREF1280_00565 [Propionibacterium sp. KPL1854]